MSLLNAKSSFQQAVNVHKAGDAAAAKHLYEEILRKEPDRPDVLYNLALALITLNEVEKAKETLESVLDKAPGHADALNNLGALLLKQDQTEQALQCFSSVINGNPTHVEARNNLAVTLLQLGKYYHAIQHFRLYLERSPDDIGARYSYATALLDFGDFTESIVEFEKVLYLKPDHWNALSNLGIAQLKSGQCEKAKENFEKVLREHPHSPEIAYLYSALTQENIPEKPPIQYIQHLFDHYAKYYESHMVDSLHYQVPQQLAQMLEKNILLLPDRTWDILDIGCGTGLSGLPFRKFSKKLTGIDLSPKMLLLAKNKLIYDELIEAECVDYLKKSSHCYDLCLASDTFNYFGELAEIFNACTIALKPKGYLLFSIEQLNASEEKEESWSLKPHGRYCHSRSYLKKIAELHHFKIITIEESVLRVQNQMPVSGLLCLFQQRFLT